VEAEEGSVYLRYAWDSPVWRALLAPHQGYYSLFANLCGVLSARVLPLQWAGHFYFFAEIAIEMLLVYVLVECECFTTVREKALAIAVMLLIPNTASISLSTINAQFYLGVIAGVILISDAERHRTIRIALLGFCGLNGVLSCVLFPLYLFQAYQERTIARWVQVGALGVGCLVQALAILVPGLVAAPHPSVAAIASSLFVSGFVQQFLGQRAVNEVLKISGSPRLGAWAPLWRTGLEIAAALYLTGIIVLAQRNRRAVKLVCAAAILGLVPTIIRGTGSAGGRYFYLCTAFVGLALTLTTLKSNRIDLVRLLLAASLISGAVEMVNLQQGISRAGMPVWSQEVAAWRQDPNHPLKIEQNFWIGVKLTPQPGNQVLPANVYDSTMPGWRDR
jgi:hypothetical protein